MRAGRRLAMAVSRRPAFSIVLDRRRRRHAAVLCAAIAVTVFGYVLLQPRKVHVLADGQDLVVSTHLSQDGSVLHRAGVAIQPGDRVTELAAPGADVLRVERAESVTLLADGSSYQILTHARTIDQLLAEADVAIGERDTVVQDGELVSVNAPVEPPRIFTSGLASRFEGNAITIEVRRAMPFSISDDGRVVRSSSSRQTVAQALREAGITVGPGDVVRPDAQSALEPETEVLVRRAKALTVTLPDDHRVLYTLAGTVGEALADAQIAIPDGAFTEPAQDTPVTGGMSVRVVQLAAGDDLEREYIESGTIYRPDPSLPTGETRTTRGHDGARVRRYDVSYVNGVEVARTLVDDYFDPEPVDTVVYYPVQKGHDEAPPPATAGRTLRVYATWYDPASSGRSASDPAYGHTATGATVTYGIVAVDPDVIPLGTKMFIPGYGYAVAADTGGAVKGYIIDLGFPDGVQVDWQSQWVEITILS